MRYTGTISRLFEGEAMSRPRMNFDDTIQPLNLAENDIPENTDTTATSKATQNLVDAIHNDNKTQAVNALKNGARVNALIQDVKSSFHHATPLQLAITKLNYVLVKILLEHCADPNIQDSDNTSTLEYVMLALGNRTLKEAKEADENTILSFFKKLSGHNTFSEQDITTASNILDILLCYNIQPRARWSQNFTDSIETITQKDRYKNVITKMHQKSYQLSRDDKETTTTLKGNIVKISEWAKRIYSDLILKEEKSPPNSLVEFIDTQKTFQDDIQHASQLIQQEKTTLSYQYYQQLYQTSSLPRDLISLTLQYIDITKEVAEKRYTEKRTINFWRRIRPEHTVQPSEEISSAKSLKK